MLPEPTTTILFVLYASFLLGVFMLSFGFSTLFMLDFRSNDEYYNLKQKELSDYDIKTMKDNYDEVMINNFLSCFMFNVKEVVDRFEYKIYRDQDTNNYFISINISHLYSNIILDRTNGFYHLCKDGKVFKSGLLSIDSMFKIDALIDIEEKYQFTQKIIDIKPELKTI